MHTLDKVIEVTRAKKSGDQFLGHCPAHDDHNPSLSIRRKNGTNLVFCHTGCPQEEVIESLRIQGAWGTEGSKSFESFEGSKSSKDEIIEKSLIPISPDSIINKYLNNRGLNPIDVKNSYLKEIPTFEHYEEVSGLKSFHPCLVSIIIDVVTSRTIGYQVTYLDNNGNKAEVSSPRKIFGKRKGGFVPVLGSSDKKQPLILTEGVENAITISQKLDLHVFAVLSANNLCLPFSKKVLNTNEVHIYVDKDKSFTGEKESLKAKYYYEKLGFKVTLIYPQEEIDKKQKGIDFNDLLKNSPIEFNDYFNGQKETSTYFTNLKNSLSKPSKLLPVMPFDYSMLPKVLEDYVKDCSYRMSVPPDAIATPLISALSGIIARRFCIYPKSSDASWKVVPVIWSVNVNESGSKKTACIKAGSKFLDKIQQTHFEEHQKGKYERAIKLQLLEKEEEKLSKQIVDKPNDLILIEKLRETKVEIERTKHGPRRYILNDATVEKIVSLLKENPNGLIIFRDELQGFLAQMSKKGFEGSREFYLEAYNGDGSFAKDTLSRGTDYVSGVAIGIISGTQPDTMRKIVLYAITNHDDGFIQRFQMMTYPDYPKESPFINLAENIDASNLVFELFRKIDHIEPNKMRALKFDEEAQERFGKWCTSLHSYSYDAEIISSHIRKYDSLVAKLALIFQVCEDSHSNFVSLSSLNKAIQWSDYLKSHAIRIYSLPQEQEATVASMILEKILRNDIYDGMTVREIFQKKWSSIRNGHEFESALRILESHHILRVREVQNPKGGPVSKKLSINPLLSEYMNV